MKKALNRHQSQINLFNRKIGNSHKSTEYNGEEIELKFNCKDLIKPLINFKNSEKISKSDFKSLDPILKLYSIKTLPCKKKAEIFLDSTDAKKLSKNPNFLKPIILYREPELASNLRIKVYHKTKYFKDILIGQTNFEFEDFNDRPLDPLKLTLRREGRYAGQVFIRKQKRFLEDFEYTVTLKLEEDDYKKNNKQNLHNYFLRFYRPLTIYGSFHDAEEIPKEAWILSKETMVLGRDRDILKFQISPYEFCAGRSGFWLKVEVYQLEEKRNDLGQEVKKIKLASDGFFMLKDLQDEDGAMISTFDKKVDHHLDIKFLPVVETGETNFPNFLKTGLKFSVNCLVDFSIENFEGFEEAFHSKNPVFGLNKYESAISKIMPIFEKFSEKSKVDISGVNFRSSGKNFEKVFPLEGEYNTREFLKRYRETLDENFFPEEKLNLKSFLEKSLNRVEECYKNGDLLNYHLLVIFTSGNLSSENMNFNNKSKNLFGLLKEKLNIEKKIDNQKEESFKSVIKELEKYPVSVFVICLNPQYYDKIMFLTDKKRQLKKQGIQRNFINMLPFSELEWNLDILERELLRNLPQQVINYYHENLLNKLEN